MSTATENKPSIVTGIFELDEKYKFPCLLYEKEQDLMTEVHEKFIPFVIPGPAYLLLTEQQVFNKDITYRIIETDAFRLSRKYDGGDFLEVLSRGEGKTKSCLLMDERLIAKMFEKNLTKEIPVQPMTEEQMKVLDSIKVPYEINWIGIDKETALQWGEEKEKAEALLMSVNLPWNYYVKYREDLEKYKITHDWLEEKKFEYRYSTKYSG